MTRKLEAEVGEERRGGGGGEQAGCERMQVEETGICQTAGLLRNRALTFTGQAATSDKNLCTLSICIIGLEL